jgi:hypothetical protein
MSIRILGTLLFILAAIARGDNFIFPEDSSIPSTTPNPVFPWGESQQFTWITGASSVVLLILQNETDDQDILSRK